MKKISVILTTYNGEKTIEKAINSILSQNGINHDFEIELLVIDDCSTDNTVKVLRQFGEQITLLSTGKNSGGPNKGRNLGLQKVTGDYICIADHDDVWKENKITTLLPYLKQVPIVTSGYTVFDTYTNKEFVRVNESKNGFIHYPKNRTFIDRLTKSLTGQNAYLGSIMYNSKLKHILFEETFGMSDFDFVLNLFYQQESIEVSQSLYYRYVKGQNLSLNESFCRKDFYASLMAVEQYSDLFPKEADIAYKKIHGSRARYYYLTGNMNKARFYFSKSGWGLKTVLYYITSFAGHKFVRKNFNVFG